MAITHFLASHFFKQTQPTEVMMEQSMVMQSNRNTKRSTRTVCVVLALGVAMLLVHVFLHSTDKLTNSHLVFAGSNIHYVAPSGNCNGSAPCYSTVQAAVNSAVSGDEVRVATGTYTGVNNQGGLSQMVYISKTITIIGGFTTANWSVPNPESNPTVLNAQSQGRVFYVTGNIIATIRNLQMSGGSVTGGSTTGAGGGILIYFSTATLEGNKIEFNSATGGMGGGGVFSYQSNVTFNNNLIRMNEANGSAGIAIDSGVASLSKNTILSNTASSSCGGIFLRNVDATLTGNQVISNTAQTSLGGGICLWGGDSTLINNIIATNWSADDGSGVWIGGTSSTFLHNTISYNQGGQIQGIFVGDIGGTYSNVNLVNNIIEKQYVGIRVQTGSTATLDNTLWFGSNFNWQGTGTINHTNDHFGDPAFVGGGDYHLTIGSPAIDAGANAGVNTDVDGDPRPIGGGPDIGADEATVATVGSGQNTTINFGNVEVNVPAGAVTTTTSLVYTEVETISNVPSNLSFAGQAFALDAYRNGILLPNFVFGQPVTLTVHYSDIDLAGLNESTLQLLYWNGSSWVNSGITILERDLANNRLVVTTTHLTDFALFGQGFQLKVFLPITLKNP